EMIRIVGANTVESVVVKDRKTGKESNISAEGVFVEIGLLPNSDVVKNLVALNELGEIVIDCSCRTNVPGIFAAGDVTAVPHKQIVVAAGEGAKAALTAYDYLIETSQI
ncbi:MAG: FAD-dependent oxidoreductase, partial [Nitrospirota bacterium]